VQGRYYFVPEGTEPFESFLWSRHWRANSNEPAVEYGQITEAPEYYSKGEAPEGPCVPPWVIACAGGRYPLRLQVDMGPVADSSCEACSLLGGLQTLTHVPGFCRWEGTPITFCGNAITGEVTYQYQLVHDVNSSLTRFVLRKLGGTGPTFAFFCERFETWHPFEAYPMVPSVQWDDACIDWPPTIEVNPAP
jgi:hypothetical protein